MPRPRQGVKYGSAHACQIWTCPSGHIHVIGEDEQGLPEYEIVIGKKQFNNLEAALHEVYNAPEI